MKMMTKFRKIVFILFVFLLLNTKSYSEVVNKVIVNGNERISLETIKIFADINIGQNYEAADINLIIKKLYETTFFSNISAELENGELRIFVEENPIVVSVIFEGEKANKYQDAISELLILRENTTFIKTKGYRISLCSIL